MEEIYYQIGLGLGSLLIANLGLKLSRIKPLIKEGLTLVQDTYEANKDGVLDVKEKAMLYDDLVDIWEEIWSILKGLFPNKSSR